MRIRAQLRAMASSEILEMIPRETMQYIKGHDKSPMFKAFVVGHEGEARGNLIGVGNIIKRWFKSAVEKLHDKIQAGVHLFHGHGPTNETEGRLPIGEVAGKRLMKIKDRLSSIVACYIYPSYRHLPLDVASIEADIDLRDEGAGLYVANINQVTGIALGNSAIETPGFAGATLLGQLQAFAKDRKFHEEDNMEFTIDDAKALIKAEKLKPSDLFGAETLAEDPAVKGLIKTETREAVAGEYAHRKRTEEGFDKTKQELEKKLQDKDGELQKLKLDAATIQVGTLFEKQKEVRKLDEKQVKFIALRLPKFTPTKVEDLEKEFNAHLDAEIDQYNKEAEEVFGIKTEKKGDTKGVGGEPHEDKDKLGPEDKYIDPNQNPWIPKTPQD